MGDGTVAYHVVVVPDDGRHVQRAFPTAAEAAAFLRGFYGQDVHAVVIHGQVCPITPPPIHLVTAEGTFPISAPDVAPTPVATGYLGTKPPLPTGSPAVAGDDTNVDPEDDDDGDDDDDDDG